MAQEMSQALGRAFKRPLFATGATVLAAAWIVRFALESPFPLAVGGPIALLLILADIARTRRHGY